MMYSDGCGPLETRPKEGGGNAVSRTALLMLLLMAGVLLLASGVALAKNISGTEAGEKIVGTKFKDHINSLGGDDVVLGYAGATTTTSNMGVGATTSSTVKVASGTL